MLEFLIRRTDPEGSWFDVHFGDMPSVFKPTVVPSEVIEGPGELRLRLGEMELEINFEDPGVHLIFSGLVDPRLARQIVDDFANGVMRHTGQRARVIEL
jgi:hypothetical protein